MVVDNKIKTKSEGKIRILLWLICCFTAQITSAQPNSEKESQIVDAFYKEALKHAAKDTNLYYLSKEIGHRMTGSAAAEKAAFWIKQQLENLHADKVYFQPVIVPHWIRGGKDEAYLQLPNRSPIQLDILALSPSVATDGILSASVIEVTSWEALHQLNKEEVTGKIIFFNRSMDTKILHTFDAYLAIADQRYLGAVEAAKKGAAAILIRSLTLSQDDYPHTGAMLYKEGIKKIPAAALSLNSADRLSSALKTNPQLKVQLQTNGQILPNIQSNNVIAELKGSDFPEEVLSIGAHIDSWDVGEGASDDGTGIVQAIEALRLFKMLGIQPRRTIQFVFYMNEEAGAHGGIEYAKLAQKSNNHYLAAIESDAGGFLPVGFRADGQPQSLQKLQKYLKALSPYGMADLQTNQRGVDIAPMKDIATLLLSLNCDDHRLFDVHHSAKDTFEKLNRREVALGAAAMAALAYIINQNGL